MIGILLTSQGFIGKLLQFGAIAEDVGQEQQDGADDKEADVDGVIDVYMGDLFADQQIGEIVSEGSEYQFGDSE
jgi:hypothetical protein